MYALRATDEGVLFFALYAIAFRSAGLSTAQISSLFVIWSVVGLGLEIPSGAWADAVSRRRLVAFAALLRAAGFAVWTATLVTGVAPYPAFALGFLLWGACSALKSGAVQALVYDELAATGSTGRYLRIIGRAEAVALVSMLVAVGLAAPAYRLGGFPLVGAGSVAVSLVNAAIALTLPERRVGGGSRAYLRELRAGLGEARRRPAVRRMLVLVSLIGMLGGVDEYVPLWLADVGVSTTAVPLLLVPPALAMAAGAWWADSGRLPALPAVLAVGAVTLAAGAASGHPLGIAGMTVGFALWTAARLAAEARLQDTIEVSARATVLSVGGLGVEVGRIVLHGAFAVGSGWLGPSYLIALTCVPMLATAALSRTRRAEARRA